MNMMMMMMMMTNAGQMSLPGLQDAARKHMSGNYQVKLSLFL
jgi:hypothetical protein